jgi:hypothetical protein
VSPHTQHVTTADLRYLGDVLDIQLHTYCVETMRVAAPTFLWELYDVTIQQALGVMKAVETKVVVLKRRVAILHHSVFVACIVIFFLIIEFGVGGAELR